VGLAQLKIGPQAQFGDFNISDHGPLVPGSLASPVNASTEVGEASRAGDSQLESSDVASRSLIGASDPVIVLPVALEGVVFNNPGTEMVEEKLSGDSCSDDGDVSGLDAEEVWGDLAAPATELDLPLTVGFPRFTLSNEAVQVIEAPKALVVENMVSVENYCEDRECSSPLSCSPLAVITPTEFPILEDVMDTSMSPVAFSQWVKKHYRGFCKLVGFPLDSHEQQCMALLQSIEAERLKYKSSGKMKHSTVSVRKGARELRNLASSVNYDGRRPGY
jgi:hypothetical protein